MVLRLMLMVQWLTLLCCLYKMWTNFNITSGFSPNKLIVSINLNSMNNLYIRGSMFLSISFSYTFSDWSKQEAMHQSSKMCNHTRWSNRKPTYVLTVRSRVYVEGIRNPLTLVDGLELKLLCLHNVIKTKCITSCKKIVISLKMTQNRDTLLILHVHFTTSKVAGISINSLLKSI